MAEREAERQVLPKRFNAGAIGLSSSINLSGMIVAT